jgi:hypothetical protein
MGEECSTDLMRNVCKTVVEKLEGRRSQGRFSFVWDDIIKIDLKGKILRLDWF